MSEPKWKDFDLSKLVERAEMTAPLLFHPSVRIRDAVTVLIAVVAKQQEPRAQHPSQSSLAVAVAWPSPCCLRVACAHAAAAACT